MIFWKKIGISCLFFGLINRIEARDRKLTLWAVALGWSSIMLEAKIAPIAGVHGEVALERSSGDSTHTWK